MKIIGHQCGILPAFAGKTLSSNLTNYISWASVHLKNVYQVPTLAQNSETPWPPGVCIIARRHVMCPTPPAAGFTVWEGFLLGQGLRAWGEKQPEQGKWLSAEPPRGDRQRLSSDPQIYSDVTSSIAWPLRSFSAPAGHDVSEPGKFKKCFSEMGLRRMDRSKLKSGSPCFLCYVFINFPLYSLYSKAFTFKHPGNGT